MVKINVLDSSVFNRIAAGEVVDRPKSIIKELVENSIDAGSTTISIDIANGGKTYLCVSDNGCGISKNYIKTAFLPHATSKVLNYEDLNTISTLGFRGEALPSIASVSKVLLTSRVADEPIGSEICIEGGTVVGIKDAEHNIGTTIIVEKLFFNTPAREKFLKNDKSEETEITTIISNLILANPNISFRYTANDKLIFCSYGKGIEDSLYSIYPKSVTDFLIPVSYNYLNYNISGFVSSPQLTKPNRSYQTTIINGRSITNNTISTAVGTAYILMKRAFPVFILDIILPFLDVDVNVNPNKSDVRFVDNNKIFSAVLNATKNSLKLQNNMFIIQNKEDTSDKQTNLELFKENKCEKQPNLELFENIYNEKPVNTESFSNNIAGLNQNDNCIEPINSTLNSAKNKKIEQSFNNNSSNFEDENTSKLLSGNKTCDTITNNEKSNFTSTYTANIEDLKNLKTDATASSFLNNKSILKFNDSGNNLKFDYKKNDTNVQSSLFEQVGDVLNNDFSIIGQIFDTYLIVAKGNFVYLIDQHAAHERLLFDKLVEQINSGEIISQPLLTPQIVELNASDYDYLNNYLLNLSKIGLEIEDFGGTSLIVKSVPCMLGNFNINKFIENVLADKFKLSQIKLDELLSEKLAITACKAAIKAGDKLSEKEISSLIEMMMDNLPLQCPHGRPAIIKIERKDLDKLFKRIM